VVDVRRRLRHCPVSCARRPDRGGGWAWAGRGAGVGGLGAGGCRGWWWSGRASHGRRGPGRAHQLTASRTPTGPQQARAARIRRLPRQRGRHARQQRLRGRLQQVRQRPSQNTDPGLEQDLADAGALPEPSPAPSIRSSVPPTSASNAWAVGYGRAQTTRPRSCGGKAPARFDPDLATRAPGPAPGSGIPRAGAALTKRDQHPRSRTSVHPHNAGPVLAVDTATQIIGSGRRGPGSTPYVTCGAGRQIAASSPRSREVVWGPAVESGRNSPGQSPPPVIEEAS
jgi:hypothetical protein